MSVVLMLDVDAAHAHVLSERLIELGAASVELADAAAGTPEERPLFDEPDADAACWSRWRLRLMAPDERTANNLLSSACAATGMPVPAPVTLETIEDLDWVRASQAQFAAIRVSARLWIVPSWQQAPDPRAINVTLDPGRAFGTGGHATTLLCLQWLDHEVRGGETVLDYGCGSGILAIAAGKLGAARVFGIDIDPQAIETARENAARNGVRCEFLHADQPPDVRADIVVANILAGPLTLLAAAIAARTRAGGRLALAGVLTHQFDQVAQSYAPWFDLEPPIEQEGWLRIGATRRAGP